MENVERRIYELEDYLLEKMKTLNLEIMSPTEKMNRSGITLFGEKCEGCRKEATRERSDCVYEGEGLRCLFMSIIMRMILTGLWMR